LYLISSSSYLKIADIEHGTCKDAVGKTQRRKKYTTPPYYMNEDLKNESKVFKYKRESRMIIGVDTHG
jgi:hypothetical protein